MKEAKTVLRTKVIIDGVEQEVLVMPITRLDCIEDSADIMETVVDGDYIPVMDSADGGQMKKIAVEKLIQKKSDATDFSVPVSAWTASEDPDFPFIAEISDEAVTDDHIAHFDFDKASIIAAMEAVIITGETTEGNITLFAEKAPTMELSGAYTITRKGATE